MAGQNGGGGGDILALSCVELAVQSGYALGVAKISYFVV